MLGKKIKILFNQPNFNKDGSIKLIEKFIKNYKNKINLNKIKINYATIILKKYKNKNTYKNILKFIIILKKKQTYTNIVYNFYKKFHLTNGIILKKNGILEKSRKKDSKSSILTVIESLKFLKNFKEKSNLIFNIKKLKPFLNKINKILKNEINNNSRILITPQIPFYKNKFKKIKSIKRRLRKKYNVIDF